MSQSIDDVMRKLHEAIAMLPPLDIDMMREVDRCYQLDQRLLHRAAYEGKKGNRAKRRLYSMIRNRTASPLVLAMLGEGFQPSDRVMAAHGTPRWMTRPRKPSPPRWWESSEPASSSAGSLPPRKADGGADSGEEGK